MNPQEFLSISYTSLRHIFTLPYFWGSMSFVTITAMFIAPLLFNGDMKLAGKALTAKLIYAGYLFWLNLLQIIDARINKPHLLTPEIKALSFVVAYNVLVITFFWLLGSLIGALVIRVKYQNKLHKF